MAGPSTAGIGTGEERRPLRAGPWGYIGLGGKGGKGPAGRAGDVGKEDGKGGRRDASALLWDRFSGPENPFRPAFMVP